MLIFACGCFSVSYSVCFDSSPRTLVTVPFLPPQVQSLFQLQAEHCGRLRRRHYAGGHHDLHLLRPDGGQSHPQVDAPDGWLTSDIPFAHEEEKFNKHVHLRFVRQGGDISPLPENNNPGEGFPTGRSEEGAGEGHQADGKTADEVSVALDESRCSSSCWPLTLCFPSQVSENKRRYQKDGFDLDLTYVTGSRFNLRCLITCRATVLRVMVVCLFPLWSDRVIAMSFPSSGKQSFYRNPIRVSLAQSHLDRGCCKLPTRSRTFFFLLQTGSGALLGHETRRTL